MPAIWSFRAPIAFITPIWRVCWARIADRVDDEEPGHHQRQRADHAEDEEEALEQVAGCLPGTGTNEPNTRVHARFDPVADVVGQRTDAVAVEGRVVDEDPGSS